jgi:DNA-binding response OmpR family regulator
LVKPISSAKLLEALNLAYEHLHQDEVNIIHINPHTIYDTLNRTLIIHNEIIKLTKNERLLLELLAKKHQKAVSYEEIENTIWLDTGMSIDTLRSLVRLLRNKLKDITIENVSGMGYVLKS